MGYLIGLALLVAFSAALLSPYGRKLLLTMLLVVAGLVFVVVMIMLSAVRQQAESTAHQSPAVAKAPIDETAIPGLASRNASSQPTPPRRAEAENSPSTVDGHAIDTFDRALSAAEKGDVAEECSVSRMYEVGNGVAQNATLARWWQDKARAGGAEC
jgi:cytoskeletal protein RodZ